MTLTATANQIPPVKIIVHDLDELRGAEAKAAQARWSTWAELVPRLVDRDPAAMDELYRVFRSDVRFYLSRGVRPEELDDLVHDTYLAVVVAIQRGKLREPERLMGFVRTVARRMLFAQLETMIHERNQASDSRVQDTLADQEENPESRTAHREEIDFIRDVLAKMDDRDREILNRVYLDKQRPEQVCKDMGLTSTQYRLLKSRAKMRFAEAGKAMAAIRQFS